MESDSQVYRARWVLPIDGEPIADGVVEVAAGVIRHCGPTPADQRHRPLLEVAVLPRFVNAHTHLEFSELAAPLGEPGRSLPDWIPRVVAWRRERDADEQVGATRRMNSLRAGLDECTRCQVAAIGEIATAPESGEVIDARHGSRHGVLAVVFQEFIGLSEGRVTACLTLASDLVSKGRHGSSNCRLGLSPHAPYTVHRELLAGLVQLSRECRVPLAMHLAESREELELLARRTGPFASMLEQLGVWNREAYHGFSRPMDYLRVLAGADRVAVVHGNYLADDEREFLADRRDQMSLVYCPRTHLFFQHEPYPLRDLLDRGVRVALGTDSRASNPDLDLLEEVRTVVRCHEDVSPRDALRMGTLHGAIALGLEDRLGSLHPGKLAALQFRELTSEQLNDPYAWM